MRHNTGILLLIFIIMCVSAAAQPAQSQPQASVSGKLSGQLRRLLSGGRRPARLMGGGADGRRVCAFVRTVGAGTSAVVRHGGRVLARFGDICIADMPLSSVGMLAAEPDVMRIEAQRGTGVALDSVALQIGARDAYAGLRLPQAFDGSGVVVGVQDVGFDLLHPTFADPVSGRLRVSRFWDQLSADTIGSLLPVGAAYEDEASLTAYGHSRDAALIGHGTHTAGIAAGNGAGSPYRGIAFAADMCLVSNAVNTDAVLIDSADLYRYTYATDALGFKYIFDYAASVGKPCVINFSEGSTPDFSGDDQLYYEVLGRMSGPGRIIVASAGNNGLQHNYFRKPVGTASAGVFVKRWAASLGFRMKSASPFVLRLKAYGSTVDAVSIDTRDVVAAADSVYEDSLRLCGDGYVLTVSASRSALSAADVVYEVSLSGPWRIGCDVPLSVEAVCEEADVEFFNAGCVVYACDRDPRLVSGDNSHTILSPGAAPSVICVGATSYRTRYVDVGGQPVVYDMGTGGVVGAYSSRGPTLEGLVKPDVVAPGTNIISAVGSVYLDAAGVDGNGVVGTFVSGGRTYGWKSESGTSMSSPAVAGAVALWLQARPDLSPDGVREVLRATASRRGAGGQAPDNVGGYGQIDVYRGLLHILGVDGLPGVSGSQPSRAVIGVGGGCVTVTPDGPSGAGFRVSVYTCGGALVAAREFGAGTVRGEVPLGGAARGVYVVQVTSADSAVSGSSLVRL